MITRRRYTSVLLDTREALELLARSAGTTSERLPLAAVGIIKECAGLAGAISQIGASLQGVTEIQWDDTLRALETEDISAIESLLPPGQTSFFKSLAVSVNAIPQGIQERYKLLAFLLEDTPAPLAILRTLWASNDRATRFTARYLVDRSLATCESNNDPAQGIKLHDLQLDYVRALHPNRETMQLIHEAVRLSTQVIQHDPNQYASQLIGRLQPFQGCADLDAFVAILANGSPKPWLRPIQGGLDPVGTCLIRTLETEWNQAAAVTLDGQQFASASSTTLRVWDLKNGTEIRTLESENGSIESVGLAANGGLAILGCENGMLEVWDLEKSLRRSTLRGQEDVTGIAVTADGRLAISGSRDETVKLWDLANGKEVWTLRGHTDHVHAVAITPDGRFAISGSDDQTLKLWDLKGGRDICTLRGHSEKVKAVAITADGGTAVSGSAGNHLNVWDLTSGICTHQIDGGRLWGQAKCVAITADGRFAISASSNHHLKVWDLRSRRHFRTLKGHTQKITGMAITTGGQLVSVSEDGIVKIWDFRTIRSFQESEGHDVGVCAIAVPTSGQPAITASNDFRIKVWDTGTGRVIRTLVGHKMFVKGLAVTPDGRHCVSGSWDYTIKVWDLNSGRILQTMHDGSWVESVTVTSDGRRAISVSSGGGLRVWRIVRYPIISMLYSAIYPAGLPGLETLLYRRAGNRSVLHYGPLRLWREIRERIASTLYSIIYPRALRTFQIHQGSVNALALTRDERQVLSALSDGTLKISDLKTGKEIRTIKGHTMEVNGVTITSDGGRAISASSDGTLKVFDLETGNELRTLKGHEGGVNGVAVTSDGKRAISASSDHTVKVWDVDAGECITTFTCDSSAECCAVANNLFMAGDAAGRVYFLCLEE